MRIQYPYIDSAVTLFVLLLLPACSEQQTTQAESTVQKQATDTGSHGYNELANPDKRKTFTISDYNADNKDIENIERPSLTTIQTSLDTALLFHPWTTDPDGPHADFDFSNESFYIVDYDGDGDMPYDLIDRHLKIYYNDFIQEGDIISVSADTLKIHWQDTEESAAFVRWTQ